MAECQTKQASISASRPVSKAVSVAQLFIITAIYSRNSSKHTWRWQRIKIKSKSANESYNGQTDCIGYEFKHGEHAYSAYILEAFRTYFCYIHFSQIDSI